MMIDRYGIVLFVFEWFIVIDNATAFTSGCSGGFCFTTSDLGSEWGSWVSAQQWCSNNGTRLVEVTSAEMQVAMSSFLNSIRGGTVFGGRSLLTNGKRNSGSWTWVSRSDANSLSIGGTNDVSNAYGYLQLTTSGFTLTATRPTDTRQGYICEYEFQCTSTNAVMLNSRCYRSYNNEALTWYGARSRCLTNGGDLASFDFISQSQGVSVLNGSWLTPSYTYWLGLRREFWTWQGSQADVKYSNWQSGDHPRTLPSDPSDCLCIEASQWKWLECRCGDTQPIVCFSEILSSSITSTTTSTIRPTTTTTTTTTTTKTPSTRIASPTNSASNTISSSLSNEGITAATLNDQHPLENTSSTALQSSSTSATYLQQHKPEEKLDRDIGIGIGVGVGGGVIVLVLVIVVAVVIIRKRSKRSNPEKKVKTKKSKQLQTPDIIALQPTNIQEVNPYVAVIRLSDIDEPIAPVNASSHKPETIYADLEFITKPSLTDNNSSPNVNTDKRGSSPSEEDVEVSHIDYNGGEFTAATCATFL